MENMCCAVYRGWLAEILQNGGPGPMDNVACYLIRSHGNVCSVCRDDMLFTLAVQAMLSPSQERQTPQGAWPYVKVGKAKPLDPRALGISFAAAIKRRAAAVGAGTTL